VLLPLSDNGDWQGSNEKGVQYRVSYHQQLGLLVGRVE